MTLPAAILAALACFVIGFMVRDIIRAAHGWGHASGVLPAVPSHPSPGESAGFDADVVTLAAIIHDRNDHTGPVGPDCTALAEHLTALGYRP